VKLIPVPQRGPAVRALDATVYLALQYGQFMPLGDCTMAQGSSWCCALCGAVGFAANTPASGMPVDDLAAKVGGDIESVAWVCRRNHCWRVPLSLIRVCTRIPISYRTASSPSWPATCSSQAGRKRTWSAGYARAPMRRYRLGAVTDLLTAT
jgi:hypothetical protein